MEKLLFSWGLPPAMVKAGPEEVGREWGSRGGAEQDPLATPPLWPRPLGLLATPLLSQVLPRPCSLETHSDRTCSAPPLPGSQEIL